MVNYDNIKLYRIIEKELQRMKIRIDEELKEKCPNLVLGCIIANVKVTEYDEKLWKEIDEECLKFQGTMELKDVLQLENIKASRDGYKKLKKDPSKYRVSSESLVRRLVKGLGLYKVNTIVDINNLISLKSLNSVGTYDLEKIGKDICFTVGKPGETYEGIGRGPINLENMPVFQDEKGKFGSATSDSTRAMITKDTKCILMNIISFNGEKNLQEYISNSIELLKKYAYGEILEVKVVK